MFKQVAFTLNNGNKIIAPSSMGVGSVYFKKDMQTTKENYNQTLTDNLIRLCEEGKGIIHIDCAANYNVYSEVKDALDTCFQRKLKKREELWITDKFDTFLGVFSDPRTQVDAVLEKFNIKYLDLLLIHYPAVVTKKVPFNIAQIWSQMEELEKAGKVKNIGVSNFSISDLEKLNQTASVKPVINQIEWNPYMMNPTPGIFGYCQEHNILIEAYSPLSPIIFAKEAKDESEEGKIFNSYINSLAEKYSVTNSAVLLRYCIQKNVLPITTSSKIERILANHNFENEHPGFTLSADEISKITQLGKNHQQVSKYQEYIDYFQTLIDI